MPSNLGYKYSEPAMFIDKEKFISYTPQIYPTDYYSPVIAKLGEEETILDIIESSRKVRDESEKSWLKLLRVIDK